VDQLLAEPLANGRSVKTATNGFPVLRLTALRNGRIDLSEQKIGAWTAEDADRFVVEEGDFLVSRGNGSIRLVGVGGLVRFVSEPVAFPDTMIRFRLCPGVEPRLFALVWNSRAVRNQVEVKAKTTAGIFKVSQGDLATCVTPLPPTAEQHRIHGEIERLLSVAEAGATLSTQSAARLTRLRQSILKWAFEGRLVDQHPTDEPASVLLERIRAERSSTSGSETKPRRKSRPRAASRTSEG
jgi:type I restriction enzyme S subunit